MIQRGFKSQKCQTSLKLALSRIKMKRNKRAAQVNQLKKEVSQLLENNEDRTARIRVEHVIREENFMATYDRIEVYCQLIVARMQIIKKQKNCPIDLKEAISSVIFASQRCDIDELSEACKQFQAKYGKDFVVSALELRPNSGVIPLIVEKLSAKTPDIKTKVKVLTSIANDYGVKWEPQSFEESSQKANEGLLRGSSFESSNKLAGETINHEYISQSEPKQQPVKKSSFNEVTNPVKVSESFSVHDTITTIRQSLSKPRTPEWRNEGLTSSQPFNGEEINYGIQSGFRIDFQDAASAAQAAAESVEMAPRASAELASQENFSRVLPFPSHTRSELSPEPTQTHNNFSPHSNLHNQSPSKYSNSSAYLNFEGKEGKSEWNQTRRAKGSVESNRTSNVGSDLIKKGRRTNYSLIPDSSEEEKGKSVTSQAYKLSLPKYSDETKTACSVMGSDLSMIRIHQSTFPHQSRSKSKNFSSLESTTFEFCKVCKLNNNQGRKHKYFPTHAKKVASLLSRFRQKLSDVKFFLKNPSLILPNLTERGRLWCVFCELDLSDVGSTFVCENVIYHLASVEHMKSLKSFLSKNGGGTDCTDAFRLIEFDVLKWEKKCKELRNSVQSSSGGFAASLHVFSTKDIQTQLTSNCTDSLENNRIDHFTPIISYDVTPLQNHTNERCLPPHLEVARVGDVASESHVGGSSSSRRSIKEGLTVQHMSFGQTAMGRLAVEQGNQLRFLGSGQMVVHDLSNELDHSTFMEEESPSGIFSLEACQGNAMSSNTHRPFEGNADKKILCGNSILLPSQLRRSQKLNPKRIGAAWAEKRRAELEKEKREGIAIIYDPNWLPNFGGVWQTGSRKESRKEFEIEKINRIKKIRQFEAPILKPYVSKRMRLCTNVCENSIDGHVD